MKRAWIALLFFWLAGCQSSWLTDLAVQPGEMLFWDDFSDPGTGWLDLASAQGELGYADSTYRMLVSVPEYDLWAVTGQAYRDVRVEVLARRHAGSVQNRFGLVCRYQDPGNFYFFVISSDGYYTIGKQRDGMRSLVGQTMMAYSSAIRPDGVDNLLRFDCIGDILTGYINNDLIAITRDADLPSGDAGLIAGAFDQAGVEIRFDNFSVSQP